MITRAQNNIHKPKKLYLTLKHPLPSSPEPTFVDQAMRDPQWRAAMTDEITTLLHHGTWSLVPPPPVVNIVTCKWLFRIKRLPDGSVDRFKARLVARGFTQQPGLDYKEMFSPVVKTATIRLVLSLAVMHRWPLRQMDVNNTFLHGRLTETVYMAQPPGFIDQDHPTHVFLLDKSIYGLKQAPRAWYLALAKALTDFGFRQSSFDHSLFIYRDRDILLLVLVYADDLVVTGNHSRSLAAVVQHLANRFSLKDLGPLQYFLGVEVCSTPRGLYLSQSKYIRDLLGRTKMEDAKPVTSPLGTSTALTLKDESAHVDATMYRSVIGALQYLSITRPDISFVVNRLSQFMHCPSQLHWTATKQLLRYLKHTINHGLHLRHGSSPTLLTYSDADWAGNVDDRTSTSAYIVFFGGNPISWSSRKQRVVARSSTEAEYRALALAASELMWLQQLLSDIGLLPSSPPVLLCDNLGATHLSLHPVMHSRMKHIQIDVHFIRDLVAKGHFRVCHVHTADQLADLLTKPLSRDRTATLCNKIGLRPGGCILRGCITEDSSTSNPAVDSVTPTDLSTKSGHG
ncbi:hypothetical protein Dimus_038454 [Dionaea muscipula]